MEKLIFLDTETTGGDTTTDRLCQVCYKIPDGFHTEYFKPPLPMSVKAMSITHITNKMLEDKKAFEGSDMKKELESLLQEKILVAHNAKFDREILEAEGLSVPRSICTFRIARALDPDNAIPEYNLQFLRYYLELEIEASAHDAEGDVKVLFGVFDRLLTKIMKDGKSEDEAINEMLEISSKPVLFKRFNFGKHNGEEIKAVAMFDRRYLEWFLGKKLDEGGRDEDWIYTLQYYLNN
jgi:exodeoxyribonuclease X